MTGQERQQRTDATAKVDGSAAAIAGEVGQRRQQGAADVSTVGIDEVLFVAFGCIAPELRLVGHEGPGKGDGCTCSLVLLDEQVEVYRAALGDLLRVVEVPGGHTVMWDALAETSEAIEAFLAT